VVTSTRSDSAGGELDGPGGTTGQAQQTLLIAARSLETQASSAWVRQVVVTVSP
jgi:hypothetical protein